MRRSTTMMALAAAALLAVPASALTLKFDVGRDDTAGNINGIEWTAQDVANAIDTTGASTGISLTVTSATGFNEVGPNDSGTATPGAPASNFFVGDTTNDALFGHLSNFNVGAARPEVVYAIAGLAANTQYDFTFYASRLGPTNNRDALYTVDGVNSGSDFLDAVGNSDDIAQVLGIESTGAGGITLTIGPGPGPDDSNGFFYLGAMQINTTIPEPASLFLASLGGLAMLVMGRKRR